MAASALSLAELNAAVQRASGGRLAATIDGSPDTLVAAVAPLAAAGARDLGFFANPRYRADLMQTRAAAVVLSAAHARDLSAATVSHPALVIVDANDSPLPSERTRPWTPHCGHIFTEVVRGAASIRTPAVVVDTVIVGDAGGFDETIACGEDYDLWARLALRSPVCVVDEPLVRVRRYRNLDASKIARAHIARDQSLRKLARTVDPARRSLLDEERGRNALAQAAVYAANGYRARAFATVTQSLPVGWKHRHWWYGAAKAMARAAFGVPRRALRTDEVPTLPAETVETRLERAADEVRPGDR